MKISFATGNNSHSRAFFHRHITLLETPISKNILQNKSTVTTPTSDSMLDLIICGLKSISLAQWDFYVYSKQSKQLPNKITLQQIYEKYSSSRNVQPLFCVPSSEFHYDNIYVPYNHKKGGKNVCLQWKFIKTIYNSPPLFEELI